MHVFETERFRLRPYTLDDVEVAHEVLDTHSEVWQFDPGRAPALDDRRKMIERRIAAYHQPIFGALAVTLKADGRFIGYCGLQMYLCKRPGLSAPEVELFYKLGREFWGQGYATEACQEMIRHAFETLRLARIVTSTSLRNEPSLALLRRLGFQIEPDPTEEDGVLATLDNDGR